MKILNLVLFLFYVYHLTRWITCRTMFIDLCLLVYATLHQPCFFQWLIRVLLTIRTGKLIPAPEAVLLYLIEASRTSACGILLPQTYVHHCSVLLRVGCLHPITYIACVTVPFILSRWPVLVLTALPGVYKAILSPAANSNLCQNNNLIYFPTECS